MADTADGDFIGCGWSFPPSFDKHEKGVRLAEGLEEIEQSLLLLFGTIPGERPLHPRFGCDVRRFLFQAMDLTQASEFRDTVKTAILNWEPRIKVNALEIDARDCLEGQFRVLLDYTVIATNTRNNRVFPLYLDEGTNLER
jgi:hypothetical protein